MLDTHVDFYHAIQANLVSNPPLARSLSVEWEYRNRIHESIVDRLLQTSSLPGFTGKLVFGSRIGRDPSVRAGIPQPQWAVRLQDSSRRNSKGKNVAYTGAKVDDSEGEGDEDDIPKEVNVNTDLVISLIEKISTSD